MADHNYWKVTQPYGKSKQVLMSVVRNTSCSSGWLRLVIQGIFGFIIVWSFILICFMTIGFQNQRRPDIQMTRCTVQNCRVICNNTPLFGEFDREIIEATTDAESSCGSIVLTLQNAMFHNYTLPGNWLSAIRVDVNELEIVGGNLKVITPETFQSQFGGKIKVLVLEKITITTLAPDTFTGLSSLTGLHIKDCNIVNMRQRALQAVDDTLQVLNIKAVNRWDPVNITGLTVFQQLRTVDFSNNVFDDILGRNSFSNLNTCTVLFLNSCKIISIGAGAFDALQNIEILHLNNNYLISLPHDIFNAIIPRKPRITLQDNLWNCSCYSSLRKIFNLGLLIVEPTCFYPIEFRGEKFSSFEKYCFDELSPTMINEDLYVSGTKSVTIIQQCAANSSQENYTVRLYSPLSEFKCLLNTKQKRSIKNDQLSIIDVFSPENNWLKPSFSVDSNVFSMVSLDFTGPYNYGLMWYHSMCPKEVYCIDHLPKFLRVYNKDSNSEYIFCRIDITTIDLKSDQCVAYNLANLRQTNIYFYKSIIILIGIAIACLLCGALCVYALIHKNPILLKGNKRVVFVKHKTVDALILPAKTSLRYDLLKVPNTAVENSKSIFFIPKNNTFSQLTRTNSVKTNESNDPSYISALQPTEDQLAEWRITRNFEATYTYDSINSNSAPTHTFNTLAYYSNDNIENIYDTVKF